MTPPGTFTEIIRNRRTVFPLQGWAWKPTPPGWARRPGAWGPPLRPSQRSLPKLKINPPLASNMLRVLSSTPGTL
jgi:hypothetical protein